jgi:hypothetical protein
MHKMIVFFAILIFYMMCPQTGHRVHGAWSDPDWKLWMAKQSNSQFLQLCSMYHFIDNTDVDGAVKDSLNKIWPYC